MLHRRASTLVPDVDTVRSCGRLSDGRARIGRRYFGPPAGRGRLVGRVLERLQAMVAVHVLVRDERVGDRLAADVVDELLRVVAREDLALVEDVTPRIQHLGLELGGPARRRTTWRARELARPRPG